MSPSNELPIEILEQIIAHCYDESKVVPRDPMNRGDKSFLAQTSIIRLLNLRLVSKSWSTAILSSVYKSLYLRTPWVDRYVMKMWENCMHTSHFSFLRQLSFDQLMYIPSLNSVFHEALPDESRRELELEYKRLEPNWVLMQDATDIIELCGRNLSILKLSFHRAIGFSTNLIIAIKHIRELKNLIIEGTIMRSVVNDCDSLSAVLRRVPSLESLSLRLAVLEYLKVDSESLPNLRHFWVSCHPGNINTISHFCLDAGRHIKFLEFVPASFNQNPAPMIIALQDTLEGLFINSIPDQIPRNMIETSLPQLKVLRFMFVNPSSCPPLWLRWGFFQRIEVFITSYAYTRDYWLGVMSSNNAPLLATAKNLKNFIFITDDWKTIQDFDLVAAFSARGISCQFQAEMSYTDVLGRVEELNNE